MRVYAEMHHRNSGERYYINVHLAQEDQRQRKTLCGKAVTWGSKAYGRLPKGAKLACPECLALRDAAKVAEVKPPEPTPPPGEFRVVVAGASGPFLLMSRTETLDGRKATRGARRIARDYPPQDGCFSDLGVNPTEVQVQHRATPLDPWAPYRRFKRVAAAGRQTLSLRTIEVPL